MTVRTQIRDRFITELNAAPPSNVPEASTRRYIPGARITKPQIAVFFVDEPSERVGGRSGAVTRRNLTVAIQCVIVCEDPADADDVLEPLLEHVVATLGDTNLASLATDVAEVGTQWGTDTSTGLVVHMGLMRYRVEYQTVKDDLDRKQ